MVLFVSDLHYDHQPPPGDPLLSGGEEAERELLACLDHYRSELTHVALLGDLFDAWIEYRDLVPKGLTRLMGTLARWADQGLRVTVTVGNHDPWHRDYLAEHLGFEVRRRSMAEEIHGRIVVYGHGDQEAGGGISAWQRFIRSRPVHRAYAELLPGGFGLWLARMWSRGARSSKVDPRTVAALRVHALELIEQGKANAVIYGHGHRPEQHVAREGTYVNTGSWALFRSYAVFDGDLRLLRWTDDGPQPISETRQNPNRLDP